MVLSVIVPIYNACSTLNRCIDSIVNQSFSDLEIVLINDGSDDESGSLCKEYVKKDRRVVYVEQENMGVDEARKKGVTLACGDYITFVDADDYLELNTYEKLIKGMSSEQVDIIAFDVVEETDSSTKPLCNMVPEGVYYEMELREKIYPKMLSIPPFFSFGILPSVYSKLFRQAFLCKIDVQTDGSIAFGEDAAFVFQTLAFAKSLQVQKCKGYHYTRSDGNSLTWKPQGDELICRLQESMKEGFQRADILDVMQHQLKEYIIFIRLLKAPQTVKKVSEFFERKNGRIALYGAGGFGQAIFHEYQNRVSLWIDRDYEKYGFLNSKVSTVEDLNNRTDEYNEIYIAIINETLCKQIKEDLLRKGINKEIHYFCINDI